MDITKPFKFWVDLALFGIFLAAFFYDLTGLDLHQRIGVAIVAMATYHLITQWSWVRNVTNRLLGRLLGRRGCINSWTR